MSSTPVQAYSSTLDAVIATGADAILASQTGNNGKVLGTNGTNSSWVTPLTTSLPSQTGCAAKFLQTDGTNPLWAVAATSLVFDVMIYGATGDGSTDDTAAIQSAIDAAEAAGGGRVWFPVPSVSYKISSTLTVQDYGVVLEGASRASVLAPTSTNFDAIKIGGIASDVFRCGVKNLSCVSGAYFVHISYHTAQCYVDELYASSGVGAVKIQGDYTANPIKDAINHHIGRIEGENCSGKIVYLYMCGDVYIDDIQTPSPQSTAYGLVIDSGVTAVYASKVNATGCKGGIRIFDNGGISPNPTSLPTTPRQLYFYNVQGDTCIDFGVEVQKGYQINFVDSWGSGCTGGSGWVFGDGTHDYIQQIGLFGCRALGNANHGFHWKAGNTRMSGQMIGCHGLSNGTAASNTYDGVRVDGANDGIIIQGGNYFNDTTQGLSNVQKYGINFASGAITRINAVGNNLSGANGNLTAGLNYGTSTHTGNYLRDNAGFNDVGFASSPTFPATGVSFSNPYARDMLVYINGGASVTGVLVDTITISTATNVRFTLGAGHAVKVNYTGATPSWSWIGM